MINWKTALELVARCLIYSSIVAFIDFILIVFLVGELNQTIDFISFVMLFEGGMGLAVGGAAAFYSPVGAKISEVLLHTKPWNAKRQKEVEKQARVWIITGIFLIFAALILSAF